MSSKDIIQKPSNGPALSAKKFVFKKFLIRVPKNNSGLLFESRIKNEWIESLKNKFSQPEVLSSILEKLTVEELNKLTKVKGLKTKIQFLLKKSYDVSKMQIELFRLLKNELTPR